MSTPKAKRRIKAYITEGPLLGLKYWTLPADAESYERMVEQMARAIYPTLVPIPYISWANDKQWLRHVARAALRAIGITPPKKGRK
jgi:hypothetical protein